MLGSHSVLRRIDPRTEGLAGRSIRLPRDKYGLTAGAGALWAVNPARRRIVRIDPGSGKLTSARVAGVQLRTLAVTDTDVWVATGMSRTGSRLTRFDPRTLRRTGATRISFPTFALAASGSRVWAMDTLHGAVAGFDREGRRVARAELSEKPGELRASGGDVFAFTLGTSQRFTGRLTEVVRLDGRDGHPVGPTLRASGSATAVAAAGRRVWLAERRELKGHDKLRNALAESDTIEAGFVRTLDAATGRDVERPVRVGASPGQLVRAGGLLWVADAGEHSVRRVSPGLPAGKGPEPTPAALREKRRFERLRRALKVKPSTELGCEPGDPGSATEPLGPPVPRIVAAERVNGGVELRWHFDHELPRSDACRPQSVLATVYTGKHASSSYRNYTTTVRVHGRDGRALLSVRYIGRPPYHALLSSAALTGRQSRHVEGPVR